MLILLSFWQALIGSMLTRHTLLLLAAGAAMATIAAPAHAITQTQTVGPQSFSVTGTTPSTAPIVFTGFNSTLGTLTAVKLSNSAGGNGYTATFSGTIGLGQFDTVTRTYTAAGTPGFIFSNGSALSGSTGSVILTPPQVSTVGLTPSTASGTYTNTSSSSIAVNTPTLQAYFTGSPTINFYSAVWTLTAPDGGGFFNNALTMNSSQLYLTYEYDDGVNPVPGPLPVLGAGAAFGFSRKLRKRIRSSAS